MVGEKVGYTHPVALTILFAGSELLVQQSGIYTYYTTLSHTNSKSSYSYVQVIYKFRVPKLKT